MLELILYNRFHWVANTEIGFVSTLMNSKLTALSMCLELIRLFHVEIE